MIAILYCSIQLSMDCSQLVMSKAKLGFDTSKAPCIVLHLMIISCKSLDMTKLL